MYSNAESYYSRGLSLGYIFGLFEDFGCYVSCEVIWIKANGEKELKMWTTDKSKALILKQEVVKTPMNTTHYVIVLVRDPIDPFDFLLDEPNFKP